MNILVTGGTGFLGARLVRNLFLANYSITVLSRDPEEAKNKLHESAQCEILKWDPSHQDIPTETLHQINAVIHLAGPLKESRLHGLQKLIQCIQSSPNSSVKTLLTLSDTSYYGNRGEEQLTETSSKGSGILSDLCQEIENTLFSANLPGVRKVALRAGTILDKSGGILKNLFPLFNARLGGPIGNGQQWVSWIHRDDLISMIDFILRNPSVEGVVNATSPNPVPYQRFSKALAETLERPHWLKMPTLVAKLAIRDCSEAILLSRRALPERLLKSGFKFNYAEIEDAIHQTYGKSSKLVF